MKFFIEVEMDGERNNARDMLHRVETVKLRINFYRERGAEYIDLLYSRVLL